MTFVESYDRNKSLQEQIEFPLKAEGLELILLTDKGKDKYFLHKHDKKIMINELGAIHIAILMKDGYVSNDEFINSVYGGIGNYNNLSKNMSEFNIKAGEKIIKKSIGKAAFSRGYFIGYLSSHRNEEENLRRYGGFTLNVITRCVKMPNHIITYLTFTQAKIMEILIESNGKSNKKDLGRKI